MMSSLNQERNTLVGRLKLLQVQTPKHVQQTRELFQEYQRSLGIDLCFQDFERELAGLPGEYAPPSGRLLLCFHDDILAGCVALRRMDETICEMKRLYVKPAFRGSHTGRALAQTVIDEARSIGYKKMRLDTLPSMIQAISLYRSLGFKEIKPYRLNPVPGALFMELDLSSLQG